MTNATATTVADYSAAAHALANAIAERQSLINRIAVIAELQAVVDGALTFQTIAELKASAMYRRWVELDTEIGAAITARDKAQSYSYVREDGTPVQSKAIARHQATIDRLLPEWEPLDEMILKISADIRKRR